MHLVMFDIDGTLVNTTSFEDECYLRAVKKVIPYQINTDWSSYANATDSGILDEIISENKLDNEKEPIHKEVKRLFISYIKKQLRKTQALEIPGARVFVKLLKNRNDVSLAIATGGWEETAKMKLESAGIDYSNIAFASGSDHKSRAGIMKIAEKKCSKEIFVSKSYFGDAIWDKEASRDLQYNFILVGNRFKHSNQIDNYSDHDVALSMIGL
ncbi:MAG: HAD family hydrolase [Desulfobacteraceae bacterium]